jgi:predicted enzyme related to lactoylglutathione lyase
VAGVNNGEVSYLQLPALDVKASAMFYTEVFSWSFVPDFDVWPGRTFSSRPTGVAGVSG